jgi:hypothetical protein
MISFGIKKSSAEKSFNRGGDSIEETSRATYTSLLGCLALV